MSAFNFFLNKLVPLCRTYADTIDLSILNEINVMSPTKAELKYTDLQDCLRGIEDAIVRNFALNASAIKRFDVSAIKAMEKILKNEPSEEGNAQKIFLLHVSEVAAEPGQISNFIIWCSKMCIDTSKNTLLHKWQEVAEKILENPHVTKIIDSSIQEFGITISCDRSSVNIVWVKNPFSNVRGFAGVNRVYVNQKHFLLAYHCFEDGIPSHMLELLMIVDLASSLVHELAHMRLRKCSNDFNVSSPVLAKINHLPGNYNEFGRCVEEKVFGAAVDWLLSANALTMPYMEMLVNAIKSSESIPIIEDLSTIFVREEPVQMALDYKVNRELF